MFNLSLDYTTDLTDEIEMVWRLNGYAQSGVQNYIRNDHPLYGKKQDNFSLWNASASFNKEQFTLTFFMKNILNAEGVTANFSEAYMGTSPEQNYFGNGAKREITLPRTVGIALRYNF